MAHLPVLGTLLLAVVGTTAGRYYIDITSGVPPKQFVRSEWFVVTALLTGVVWVICHAAGLNTWSSAGISFAIGFTFRVLALYLGWEEPLAKEPAGVYKHSDGRPSLGRKLVGKSQRELKDLWACSSRTRPRVPTGASHDHPASRVARRSHSPWTRPKRS